MTKNRIQSANASRTALLVCLGGLLAFGQAAAADPDPVKKSGSASVSASPAITAVPPTPAATARPDPVALLREAQRRCAQEVQEYSCVFLRQERIDGKLSKQQTVEVRYRANPRSVYMTWVGNTDQVKRALYVKGRNVGKQGEERVLVEPAGALIRLVVDEVSIPVCGKRARKTSRHTIDQFGFHSTLERINRDNERFAREGVLNWSYEGEGVVDGHPTYILVRHLPYAGPTGPYSDARLVLNLDQERLLPLSINSFADEQGRVLLGSYVTTQVKLNPGFGEVAFKF